MPRKGRERKQKPAPAVHLGHQNHASSDKTQACGATALLSKCLRCCGHNKAVLDDQEGELVVLTKNTDPDGGPKPGALPPQGTSYGSLEPLNMLYADGETWLNGRISSSTRLDGGVSGAEEEVVPLAEAGPQQAAGATMGTHAQLAVPSLEGGKRGLHPKQAGSAASSTSDVEATADSRGITAAVNLGTHVQMAASLPGAEKEVTVPKEALPLVGESAVEVLWEDSQAGSLAGNTAELQGLGEGPFGNLAVADTAMPSETHDPSVMASSLHTRISEEAMTLGSSLKMHQAMIFNDAPIEERLTILSPVSDQTALLHFARGSFAAPNGALAEEHWLSSGTLGTPPSASISAWGGAPLLTDPRPSLQPLSKLGSKTVSGNPFAEPQEDLAEQSLTSAAGQNTMAEHLSFSVTATEQMGSFAAMPDTVSPKLFPAMSGNPFAESSSPAAYQQVQASYADQPWVQPDARSVSRAAATAAAQMVPATAMPAEKAIPSLSSAPSSLAAISKTLSGHVDLQAQVEPPQTTSTNVAAAAEPQDTFIAAVYPTATSAHTDVPAGRSLSPSADWQQHETAVLQPADSHPAPTSSVTKWSSMPEQSWFSTSVEAQMQEMNLNSLLYSRQAALTGSQAARKWYLQKPFSSMPSLRTCKPTDLHGSFHKLIEEDDEEPQVEVTQLSTLTEDMPTAALAMHLPAVADRSLTLESSQSSCGTFSAPSVTMPQSSRASEASCVSGRADLCLLRGQTGFTDKDMSALVGTPKRGLKKLLKLGSLGRNSNDKGYGRLQETPVGTSGITQQGMAEGKVNRRLSRRISGFVAAKFCRSTSQDSGATDSGITVENVSTEVGAAVDSATEAGLQSTHASAGISIPRRTVRRLSSLFSRADRYQKADV